MDPLEALQKYVKKPEEYPLQEVTVDGIDYYAFGDHAYKKNTLTSLQIYGKNDEYYSLESLVVFLKYRQDNHGFYVKEAAAANVRAVTRIDRKNVTECLQGDRTEFPTHITTETPLSLKKLQNLNEPEAKKPRLDGDAEKTAEAPKTQEKKEVEMRALNDSLTVDRIAEMRRKRQSHREKGIVTIDESLSTLTAASLPKTRIHRTRENVMLGARDLTNVLDIIAAAQRQWDLNEKREKVAAVHATSLSKDVSSSQQRSGYSRYAQEAFAHEKTKEIQTEGSFIGSNLSTLKQGHAPAKTPEAPSQIRNPVSKPTPSPLSVQGGKRASRSPIIIVPSAMSTMINLYNARDILQNLGFIPAEKRRAETNKKPTDLAIQRQKNGTTYNIRVIDNAEKLANEDWDRVIAVFVMGVAWQFKGWKWNGNPTDIFTHVPAFYFHFDNDKPAAQVLQWNVHKIPVSATKRHMDKARFSQMWETIENFVRKNKPHLTSRLGL